MKNTTGIIAEFKDPHDLLIAAEKVKKSGYKAFEVYSPFPIHGMDDAMGEPQSKLGWLSLTGGLIGFAIGTSLQTWVAISAYPLNISGKPLFSYPAFVPVTFELTILLTGFFTVFGMFALNKLPQWYHPVFEASRFEAATSHGFFLVIESQDKQFNAAQTSSFLKEIGGANIEVVEEQQ